MKLSFTPQELSRWALLREMVAEIRAVSAEVKLADERLPELTKSEQSLRDAIPQFSPSQLVAFGPEVRQAWRQHQDAEFILTAMRQSSRLVTTRVVQLNGQIACEFKELQKALRWRVKEAFPAPGRNDEKLSTNSGIITPACSAAINRVVTIAGETAADRAEALIAVAMELGLELPAVGMEATA